MKAEHTKISATVTARLKVRHELLRGATWQLRPSALHSALFRGGRVEARQRERAAPDCTICATLRRPIDSQSTVSAAGQS